MSKERLQKILAQSGVASRRASEKLISAGKVRLNGRVVAALGTCADLSSDKIEVEGFGQLTPEKLVYLMMHKPEGVLSTNSDPNGRMTVLDLLGKTGRGSLPRLYPVGRLDYDAEGLLILTNDGDMTARLLHPKQHVPKVYMVKFSGHVQSKEIKRLASGVRLRLDDGRLSHPTAPAHVELVRHTASNTWCEITLIEGRNRQIRRMGDAIGHSVLRLIRTQFGLLQLDDLPAGTWRFLSSKEHRLLSEHGRSDLFKTSGSRPHAKMAKNKNLEVPAFEPFVSA